MAVRFDEGTDRLTRATGPAPSAGWTYTAWIYLSTDRNNYSTHTRLADGGTIANIALASDGQTVGYFTIGGLLATSTVLSVGDWARVAATVSGTTATLYSALGADGATVSASGTVDSSGTPTSLSFGGRGGTDYTEWFDGRIAYARMWTAVLTQGEIEAEWASDTAVRGTNLWADWPLSSPADLTDHSGNGRDLTAGPTATTLEDGPPLTSLVSGTGTAALGALTGTAAGTRTIPGTGTATLGALTGTAVGSRAVTGAAAGTLGALTAGADGTVDVTGVAVASLGALTAGMVVPVQGSASTLLGALTAAAAGVAAARRTTIRPTNELVAVGWLKSVTGETTVATDVPADNTSWSASGFVQVQAIGGTPNNDVPIARPVLSVDCWAVTPGSGKPPWGKANARAEAIRDAVLDHPNVPLTITTLPAAYADAQVLSAVMLTEPRRVLADDGDYAHYQLDVQLWWIEVPA